MCMLQVWSDIHIEWEITKNGEKAAVSIPAIQTDKTHTEKLSTHIPFSEVLKIFTFTVNNVQKITQHHTKELCEINMIMPG